MGNFCSSKLRGSGSVKPDCSISDFHIDGTNKAIDSASVGIWKCSSKGVLTWNKHMYLMFDIPRPASGTLTYEEFILKVHPDDRSSVHERVTKAQADATARYEATYRVVWRDGSVHKFQACSENYKDQDGTMSMIGTVFDITILASVHEKEAENLALGRELAAQKRHNDEILTLLRTLSHEIRNPLQGILGSLAIMESVVAQAAASGGGSVNRIVEELRPCLQDQQECALHQLRVVNDLLDYGLMRGKRRASCIGIVNLDELIAGVIRLCSSTAKNKGLAITRRGGHHALLFESDPQALTRILVNLVSNAVKFTPVGGVSIEVIRNLQEGELTIDVVDSGIGVPAEFVSRLFNTVGLTATNNDYTSGAGIGLCICQELAATLGGRMAYRAGTPTGSIMSLTFPVTVGNTKVQNLEGSELAKEKDGCGSRSPSPASIEVPRALSVQEPLEGKGLRALLVDDNRINQRALHHILAPMVKDVVTCSNGLEAVERFEKEAYGAPFGLVLMDVHMPVMDGFAAVERIRGTAINPHVHIVFVTAETEERVRDACHRFRCALLTKPCSKAQLASVVADAALKNLKCT